MTDTSRRGFLACAAGALAATATLSSGVGRAFALEQRNEVGFLKGPYNLAFFYRHNQVQVGRAAHARLLGRDLRRGRGGAWHRLEHASDARCAGHALDLASGPFGTADAGRAAHALDRPVDCRSRGLPGPGLSARTVRVAGALPSPA